MATFYSTEAASQNDAILDQSKAVTYKNEKLETHGVITLTAPVVANDVFRLELVKQGAIFDWAGASIVSTNAALAGTIGLVNPDTGVYTAYGTLTAASNIGRLTAPTQLPAAFSATTASAWVAYQLGASPPTSGSALIRVGRTVLAS